MTPIKVIKNRLSEDKLFLRRFMQLFLFIAVIFSVFTIYVYNNSRKVIEQEFINVGAQNLRNVENTVDELIMDTKYLISALIVDENFRLTYMSPEPEKIWSDYVRQIQNQLEILQSSREVVEAIYLYSEKSEAVYSSEGRYSKENLKDKKWFDKLDFDENGFSIFPYGMYEGSEYYDKSFAGYPYVICVAQRFLINGTQNIIAVMLNLSRFSYLKSIGEEDYQSIVMVSDDGKILYRYRQEKLAEPLSTVDYLVHYEPVAAEKVFIAKEGKEEIYCFAQVHSGECPWTYVFVTYLDDYASKVSTSQALLLVISGTGIMLVIFFCIYFVLLFFKPLWNLRSYLEFPDSGMLTQMNESKDVKYIVEKITQYTRVNQGLKEELQNRMILLEETELLALQSQINPHFLSNTLNLIHVKTTGILGYEHPLASMIVDTSKLIRYAIESTEMVTLRTEMEYTDIYLSILNERYGCGIAIRKDTEEEALLCKVPRLFIQPVIENAVFHGFSKNRKQPCDLEIDCFCVQEEKKYVVVRVKDNGKGMTEERIMELRRIADPEADTSENRIGFRNVIKRMRLIYGEDFSVEIDSKQGEGTCIALKFIYI